jgi:hypothetical protein
MPQSFAERLIQSDDPAHLPKPNMTNYLHDREADSSPASGSSTALILLSSEEVLSCRPAPAAARMRWSGQIFWLLAFEAVESFCLRIEKVEKSPYAILFSPSTLDFQL